MTPKELVSQGDQLFSNRGTLMSMWQEIADNFYVERADFTSTRSMGDNFADHLTTSYPILVRRDLGNSLGTMMRPTSIEWFHMKADREEYEDQPAKEWLEWAGGVQRRAMYDRSSLFKRASKEADQDNAAFGQSVKTVELNRERNGLLYRCWHLRDCVWRENDEGKIDTVHRKWKPTALDLSRIFGDKIHSRVSDLIIGSNKNPYAEINVRHIVMPASQYGGGINQEYVSVFIDVDNMHVMEVMGQNYFMYVIPRWQTVSGSQYSFSPATVAGLPDARLLQAMTRTLLEAGEKAVAPPMIGVEEAMRSDLAIYAGGVTWVDEAYDERLGEVLRPLAQDLRGLPQGFNTADGLMGMLREAFFLNTLTLPQSGPEMTAYEVGQRVQDYIRQAAPIFEPLEDEDNGAVCETTFDLLMKNGAFGSVEDIPQSIRGRDIGFKFESPLHDAIERQKGNKFMEAAGILGQVIPLDPTAPAHLDIQTAFRDVLTSIGMPAKWLNSEQETKEIIEAQQEDAQTQQLVEQIGDGAETAGKVADAGAALESIAA